MSIKRIAGIALLLVLAAGLLAACGSKSEGSSGGGNASAQATPAPTPTPEPYTANVLTGEKVDGDYIPERFTGVMVNNLVAARPQRGLSQADMLFEIKVEGGITRFMPVYSNYQDIGEIGPIRSGRDQFFRLILPFQALYVHEGQSVVQAQYVQDYDYADWNINDGAYGYRDFSRINWQGRTHNNGLAIEHTMYTTGENIGKWIDANGTDMDKEYNSTFFNFVDYRSDDPYRPIENGEEAGYVKLTHSQSYKTRFFYDTASQTYQMQQYYSTDKSWRATIDETNNQQLNFTNLVVLFTDIHTYPGHEAKDLQYADYDFGGVGFYFYGGKVEKIYWQKGTPLEALRLYYLDENGQCSDQMVEVNIGKSYVSVVDLDEYENGFEYGSQEGVDSSTAGYATTANNSLAQDTEVEIGDTTTVEGGSTDAPAESTAAEGEPSAEGDAQSTEGENAESTAAEAENVENVETQDAPAEGEQPAA